MELSTEALLQEVDEYLLPLPSYAPFIVKGQGVTVEDQEGNTYLDFMSGPGVLNAGHCHPDIVAEVRRQIGLLTQCPGNTHNIESIRLAKKLAPLIPGESEITELRRPGWLQLIVVLGQGGLTPSTK